MSGSASDVAALSFAIDSSPVVTAAQALDQLRASSDQVTDAHDRLIERSQRYIAVARDMGESIAQMRRQFTDTAQSIDGMLDSLDAARAKLDGTRESFAALSDATGHVQALGEQFGVGAAGIEAFSSQAALLGLSAGQTTLALQRITEALQNQTLAGQQVRAQIQGLGVDLAGLTSNDAGSVLGTVVSRLRGTADGIGKYQTESSILGVTDPNTLYGINNQDYIPVETRRQISLAQRAQRQNSATYGQVARDERGYAQDDAEYEDLSGYYNLGRYGNVFSGLNGRQRSGLAGTLGLAVRHAVHE
jgi:methyl-accepting chemotaxis protein